MEWGALVRGWREFQNGPVANCGFINWQMRIRAAVGSTRVRLERISKCSSHQLWHHQPMGGSWEPLAGFAQEFLCVTH
jgi:hypothetical protein